MLAFIAGITTINANTNIENNGSKECHAQACEFIEFAKEIANAYYEMAFNACKN